MAEGDDPQLAKAVLMFAPEYWGQVDRFARLYSSTYTFARREARALSGVSAHFKKSLLFKCLADELRPTLAIDREELNSQGFTPANHARKLGAVFEATTLELYSSVDCTAKVLRAVFGPSTRGFKESTRALFTGYESIIGLPEPIIAELTAAAWYRPLLYLRDELTHLDTGSCSLDDETGLVRYMHTGMSRNDKPLIIEDAFAWLDANITDINGFLGRIFHQLNSTLSSTPVQQMCGITKGRMLMRSVIPTDPLTFDNGHCLSAQWFELPENPTCPFVEGCGAYRRTKTLSGSSSESSKP